MVNQNARIMGQANGSSRLLYVCLITIITILGIYFRILGLGSFPFSIDEYYFYSAAKLSLENGLPQFPCGGFYTRGILLQYITAPFIHFIENQELAARAPTVLFSALSFPAVYLIGRDTHSRQVAVLALFLFVFSIWQLEFARFARMYAPFQMVFLWQTWLILKPEFPNRGSNILLNALLAMIAVLFYAGGIFCVAMAFFNIVLHQKSFKFYEYIPASFSAVLAILFTVTPFRHLGAEDPFPNANLLDDTSLTAITNRINYSSNTLPIDLPTFIAISNYSFFSITLVAIFLFAALILLKSVFKTKNLSLLAKLILLCIPAAILFNQLLALVSIVVICLLTVDDYKDLLKLLKSKAGITFLVFGFLWVGYCIITYLSLHQTTGALNFGKAIFNNFFSYPDIFFDVLRQWQRPMPIHTIIAFLCLFSLSAYYIFKPHINNSKPRLLLALLIMMLLLTAIINTPYDTSRYTYFISPIFMVIIALSVITIAAKLHSKAVKIFTILLSTAIIYYMSEDYSVHHILSIDSYATNHRIQYSKPYTEHLYPRYDYLSIKDYLHQKAFADDLIVITTPVVESYLSSNLNMEYFITPENSEFINHTSCNGKNETWSHLPLIYNYEDLEHKLSTNKNTSWVILHGERGNPFTTQKLEALKNKLKPYFVFENPDKTLKIYRVEANSYTSL